eukprot:229837_1
MSMYKESIISYFREKQIDGITLAAIKRNGFSKQLSKQCKTDKKVHGVATKVYTALIEFNFDTLQKPMIDTMNANDEILNYVIEKLNILVEDNVDIEMICYKIKHNENIESFADQIINLIDELIE